MDISELNGKEPLVDYPWHKEIDRLALWGARRSPSIKAFCFDVAMSLAYIDATSGIEKYIESCPSIKEGFNAHLGFINLCSPCYEKNNEWIYQKAAKPQSGAIGKLSSETILRFIRNIFPQFKDVFVVGGTAVTDAYIKHGNGTIIFAEVKSAPLLTYPVVFQIKGAKGVHEPVDITTSQLKECASALYMHDSLLLPLGSVKSELWPFKPAIDYIVNPANEKHINLMHEVWQRTKMAYEMKNRNDKFYYLANASGGPPQIAKSRDKWPKRESISDSKTSAGMDRTDDIKKGIYQVLKIGSKYYEHKDIRTALISNLPAYRHGSEYVDPFIDMLWGYEQDVEELCGKRVIERDKLKRVFDYIITLKEPILRNLDDVS